MRARQKRVDKKKSTKKTKRIRKRSKSTDEEGN